MDIEKQANVFIQPGVFPGDYGNESDLQSPGIEDSNLFTGIEDGPYGDGSKLAPKDDRPNLKNTLNEIRKKLDEFHKSKMYMDATGKVSLVPSKPLEEVEMPDHKSLMNKIFKMLTAAVDLGEMGGRERLIEELGLNSEPSEVVDMVVKEISEKVKGGSLDSFVEIVKKIRIIKDRLLVEEDVTKSILDEYNAPIEEIVKISNLGEASAKVVGDDLIREHLDELKDALIRQSVYSDIRGRLSSGKKLPKSYTYRNEKTKKPEFRSEVRQIVKGPAEKTIEDIETAKNHYIEEVKQFYNTDPSELEKKVADVLKVFSEINDKVSQAKEKVERVYMVLKANVSTAIVENKENLNRAYASFLSKIGEEAIKFPKLVEIRNKVEHDRDEFNSVVTGNDPGKDTANIMSLYQSLVFQDKLKLDVEAANALSSGIESFEGASVSRDEAVANVPESQEIVEPFDEEADYSGAGLGRFAGVNFSSVLSDLSKGLDGSGWDKILSVVESLTDVLLSAANEGRGLLESLVESQESLDNISEVEAEDAPAESSENNEEENDGVGYMNNFSEPAFLFASDDYKMVKESGAEFTLPPQGVKNLMDRERQTPAQELERKHKIVNDFWQGIENPDNPKKAFIKSLEDIFNKLGENAKGKLLPSKDGGASSNLEEINQCVRTELVARAVDVQNSEHIDEIAFSVRQVLNDESRVDIPTNDIISEAAAKLSKIWGGLKGPNGKLVEAVNSPYSKLLLACRLKGSSVTYNVHMVKPMGKVVDISQLPELLSAADGLGEFLDRGEQSTEDVERKTQYQFVKRLLVDVVQSMKNIENEVSEDKQNEKANMALENLRIFREEMAKEKIDDTQVNAFIFMAQEMLEGSNKEIIEESNLKSLFVHAYDNDAEDSVENSEKSVEQLVHEFFNSVWPNIIGIWNSFNSEYGLILEDVYDSLITENSVAPEEKSSYMPSYMAEPAFSFAKKIDDIVKTAATTIIAPLVPNNMYSQYDVSENTFELRDEDGNKKLCINKSLRNLVTKKMDKLLKGAFKVDDVVNVDFGNDIVAGCTVKEYLGNKTYRISVDGDLFTVPEVNIFKL